MEKKITAEPEPHNEYRDKLAVERNRLAEERTQLAYIRTGVTLLLGGLAFVGYFRTDAFFSYIGYAVIVVALLFLGHGFKNHKKSKNLAKKVVDVTLKEDYDV